MRNNRVCFVEVETNDNGNKQLKRLQGLAIKGRVSRKMSSVESEATVSVANLTKSDIEYLTTFTSPYVKPQTKKLIRIYAGYSQTGWGKIFEGDITEALPSDLPDTWLNIKAKSLYYLRRAPVSYSTANTTMKDSAQSIAQELNLSFDWQATTNKNLDIFNFNGSKAELIKEYNRLGDVVMFEDNGKLKVIDKNAKRDDSKPVKVVSIDSGMIGIPEPDKVGVRVKYLLDASTNPGDWIQVKSVKLPVINGYYQIYELTYDFATREQQFYCEVLGKAAGV